MMKKYSTATRDGLKRAKLKHSTTDDQRFVEIESTRACYLSLDRVTPKEVGKSIVMQSDPADIDS